jgi:hypothetical protein
MWSKFRLYTVPTSVGAKKIAAQAADLLDLFVLRVARFGQPLDLLVLRLSDQGGVDHEAGLVKLDHPLEVLPFPVGDALDPVDLVGDVRHQPLPFGWWR